MSRSFRKRNYIKDREYGQKESNRTFRRAGKKDIARGEDEIDSTLKKNSRWSVRDWGFYFGGLKYTDLKYFKKLKRK